MLQTLVLLFVLAVNHIDCRNSDVGLSPLEMIANHGYESETHYVTTDDGYIVTVYRIPHGKNDDGTGIKPPVLLMHGYTDAAIEFIAMGPELALAYILADAGYDVWLPNARGTDPSLNHTDPDIQNDPEQYYDFDWHEIGYYDVAQSIDYILEKNGAESLHYVGHSQGTTVLLVLLSTRPEYNSKIKLASLMAPAAIVEHYPNEYIKMLAEYSNEIWDVLKKYQLLEMPLVVQIREYMVEICGDYPENYTSPVCDTQHESQFPNINKDMMAVIFSNAPARGALRDYIHFGQLVKNGGFNQFDFGPEENLIKYGSETPPAYDLSQVTTPVACYYAKNDGLIAVEDELALVDMLPNVVNNYLVPDDNFTHFEFARHNNIMELVYIELIKVMSQY